MQHLLCHVYYSSIYYYHIRKYLLNIHENYSFIYGANSDGTIMYAKDVFDITEKITAFVNARYKGEMK